ncbi:MAG: endonuclease/exonuclease/phosphatase family protein [Bacteroidales bacterium]|nr:endonuclease/exonuclease/phosphatase family protein [Bacteroidales bacterium]
MTKPKKKKSGTWFSKIILLVNFIFILALVLSCLSPFTNPEITVIPALFAIVFPILLVINFVFVLLWIFMLRYYFIFSLIAILASYNLFFKVFAFNGEKPVGNYQSAMKVISYNVRLFDQFKWTGNQNYFTRNSIFEFVNSEQADVVCFQEFFHGTEKYFPTIDPFLDKSETKNYHVDYVLTRGDNKHFGLATFTRYPIVGKGNLRFENSTANSGIYTDIVFQSDTIRVFNVHLESIKLSKADHQLLSDVIDPGAATPSSGIRVILSKLSRATKKRAEQAEIVGRYIAASPYPVIVCGDFNDTPLSYVYRTVSQGLNDAFLEIGSGIGASYADDVPFLRIDYILHSETLEPFRFKKHDVKYSDHFPLSCYFKMNH